MAWLALRADPTLLMQAAFARLRGLRVRSRRLLGEAAARHPNYYRTWTRLCEPGVVARWRDARDPLGDLSRRIAVLVLGDDCRGRDITLGSLARALPAYLRVEPETTVSELFAAAQRAGAEWLLVLHAGDCLAPHMADILDRVDMRSLGKIVYWDCDAIVPSGRDAPLLKPCWDPILARSHDLLGAAALIRLAAALEVSAGLPETDLGEQIGHVQGHLALDRGGVDPVRIPLVLSHHVAGPSLLTEDARRNLYPGPAEVDAGGWPGVTVIVPTRDQAELLEECIDGLDRLDYAGPIETLVLDNDSCEPETAALLARLATRPRTSVVPWPGTFNFAAMTNHAAQLAKQPYLCFLNNDVASIDAQWLSAMMAYARMDGTGAVGARLVYPDGQIQHAGVAIGVGGAAGHVQKRVHAGDPFLSTWHATTRRVSAVTAACLVVARKHFLAVGGMDAARFSVDFNDVDLCLRLDRDGLRNVLVTEATLVHHESKSRGARRTGAGLELFNAELSALEARWGTRAFDDPWHSPIFSRESERCVLVT